jgi:hypothetical protein
MRLGKKTWVILGLAAFTFTGMAFSHPPKEKFKNLKVLPDNISPQLLDKIMDEFKAGLGVRCDFCHVHAADDPHKWDFASDDKPEKTVARKMMTMTNKINRKFFHGEAKYGDEDALMEVRCATCHHGSPHPEMQEEEKNERKQ